MVEEEGKRKQLSSAVHDLHVPPFYGDFLMGMVQFYFSFSPFSQLFFKFWFGPLGLVSRVEAEMSCFGLFSFGVGVSAISLSK